ncbi:MAG: hypothetical protein ACOC1X_03470 [Promethearchaeota archaeon]
MDSRYEEIICPNCGCKKKEVIKNKSEPDRQETFKTEVMTVAKCSGCGLIMEMSCFYQNYENMFGISA